MFSFNFNTQKNDITNYSIYREERILKLNSIKCRRAGKNKNKFRFMKQSNPDVEGIKSVFPATKQFGFLCSGHNKNLKK